MIDLDKYHAVRYEMSASTTASLIDVPCISGKYYLKVSLFIS